MTTLEIGTLQDEIRALAQERDAGLIRSASGLQHLLDTPSELVQLIARSALARTESRGVHFREDYPAEDPALAGHLVIKPGAEPELERWS